MTQDELFKVLVAHCKEYGFIFPSSEIYDGLAAVYDYGQMGVELKNNIKQYWWNAMTRLNENIVGIDSCVFMHPKTWVASGYVRPVSHSGATYKVWGEDSEFPYWYCLPDYPARCWDLPDCRTGRGRL